MKKPAPKLNAEKLLKEIQDLFSRSAYTEARKLIRYGMKRFPDCNELSDYWLAVSPGWETSCSGGACELRPACEADLDFLYDLYNDAAFMNLYNPLSTTHYSREALAKVLTNRIFPAIRFRKAHWTIYLHHRGTSRPVGQVSLCDINFSHRRAELLLGIHDTNLYGSRVAISSLLLLLDIAFNHLRLNKLSSLVFTSNQHSHRSMLACGFRQEGLLLQHLRNSQIGEFFDVYVNGMTCSDLRNSARLARLSLRILGQDITKVYIKNRISC